jgi:hypothetical protein
MCLGRKQSGTLEPDNDSKAGLSATTEINTGKRSVVEFDSYKVNYNTVLLQKGAYDEAV